MSSHWPIAYTYEADHHCLGCTVDRFGADEDGFPSADAEDSEGNPIGAVFSWDEWWDATSPDREYLVCGDCGAILAAVGPSEPSVREDGETAGRNAQSWVEIDSAETAYRILRGFEDGDPETYDMIPSPLSGGWADDPGPRGILERFGFSEGDQESGEADDTLSWWEDAYREAFEHALVERCREYLKDSAHFDRFDVCEAYSVWCHDYADASDGYWARKSAQLRRIGFRPRPNLTHDTLTINGRGIYAAIQSRH